MLLASMIWSVVDIIFGELNCCRRNYEGTRFEMYGTVVRSPSNAYVSLLNGPIVLIGCNKLVIKNSHQHGASS